MTCPGCSTDLISDDFPVDGNVGICPKCARSVVKDVEATEFGGLPFLRFATSADLEHLSDADVQALRRARPKAWRDDVRARHAQIVGR